MEYRQDKDGLGLRFTLTPEQVERFRAAGSDAQDRRGGGLWEYEELFALTPLHFRDNKPQDEKVVIGDEIEKESGKEVVLVDRGDALENWDELEEFDELAAKVDGIVKPKASESEYSTARDDDDDDDDLDAPVLLLNATRLAKEIYDISDKHEAALNWACLELSKQFGENEDGFEACCEDLFERGIMFHSQRAFARDHLEKLQLRFENENFRVIEYPERICINDLSKERTCVLWMDLLSAPKLCRWSSASRLMDWIVSCSRPLVWKKDMVEQVAILAEGEHIVKLEHDEVNSRVGDLENVKMQLLDLAENREEVKTDPLIIEELTKQLVDVNKALEVALEDRNRSNEQRKRREEHLSGRLCTIDMVAGMVLPRCESFWRLPEQNQESFFGFLAEKHQALRMDWVDDFGRLPYLDSSEEYEDGLGKLGGHEPTSDAPSVPTIDGLDSLAEWIEGSGANSMDSPIVNERKENRRKKKPKKGMNATALLMQEAQSEVENDDTSEARSSGKEAEAPNDTSKPNEETNPHWTEIVIKAKGEACAVRAAGLLEEYDRAYWQYDHDKVAEIEEILEKELGLRISITNAGSTCTLIDF